MIKEFILGMLYLDTGAAGTLMLKKWYNLHELTMRSKSKITITSVLKKVLDIVGTATIMVMLMPMLEMDLGDTMVSLGDFHQFLMGMSITLGL